LAFYSAREADHSLPSRAEVKEWVELYLHSSNTHLWRGAQLGGAQENFLSQSDINCIWMPSFIYQGIINLVMRFPSRTSPNVLMNVAVWKHCTLDRFFGGAKFANVTLLK
jgi:hypothetical protein